MRYNLNEVYTMDDDIFSRISEIKPKMCVKCIRAKFNDYFFIVLIHPNSGYVGKEFGIIEYKLSMTINLNDCDAYDTNLSILYKA